MYSENLNVIILEHSFLPPSLGISLKT